MSKLTLFKMIRDFTQTDCPWVAAETYQVFIEYPENYSELKDQAARSAHEQAEYEQVKKAMCLMIEHSQPDCHWSITGQGEHHEFLFKDIGFTLLQMNFER